MKKRAAVTSVILIAVFLLALAGGCTAFQKGSPPDPGENSGDPGEGNGGERGEKHEGDIEGGEDPGDGEKGTPEERKVNITLYFGDKKAVESGAPAGTGYVIPVVREYPHTTAVLRLALQELIRGPLPGEDDLVRTMPATAKILDLKIENEIAYIDFSSELVTDSPGGTLGGAILIQSLVYTATEFPTVKSVLVTVKGETYSDGHYIWEQPIGRDDLNMAE